MVFSLMVLLPVGLCTSRLAPRGWLSAPPGRPQTGCLPLMMLTPGRPHLLLSSSVESPHALYVAGFDLAGIHVSLPSSAHDHGVELLLDHLRVLYGVHLAPFTRPGTNVCSSGQKREG